MFTLPKQFVKPVQKNNNKSYTIDHSQIRKIPDINKIKQQIESILKRNNSPMTLSIQNCVQKSHRNIHHHLLQRKKSKILQRANQQNIEKAKKNRKMYEEYLIGDLAPKTRSKSIEPRKNFHHFNLKQKSYSKQLQQYVQSSKADSNSIRIVQYSKNQKRSQSMFTDKQIKHLGLGKLLFYKDSDIKLKRSSLLQGRTSTDKKNLFKDIFYQEPNLDFTRYLKRLDNTTIEEDEQKIKKPEPSLKRENSLEVFRKEILSKQSFTQPIIPETNTEQFGIQGTQKYSSQHLQQQVKRSLKLQISPHLKDKSQEMRQILNVMDEELLVFYGKMRKRKLSKDYLPSATHRTTIIHKAGQNHHKQSFSKFSDFGNRTSIQIKTPLAKQQSWKIHHFDPWEKQKQQQDQFDPENVFEPLESHKNSEKNSQMKLKLNQLI